MPPLEIMPLRYSRPTQTLMIYSIPEPKPRTNPPVLQEALEVNKKQCHHRCTDQLTQNRHKGNGSHPKPFQFLLNLYLILPLSLQHRLVRRKNRTISVRKVISRSKDERWEKWRSFSKSVIKCILGERNMIMRMGFRTSPKTISELRKPYTGCSKTSSWRMANPAWENAVRYFSGASRGWRIPSPTRQSRAGEEREWERKCACITGCLPGGWVWDNTLTAHFSRLSC